MATTKKKKEVSPYYIKTIDVATINKIKRKKQLFGVFLNANKGFADEIVLSVIGRNRTHADYDDLLQVCNYGIFKAMKSWDIEKSKFSTFAFTVARNEIRQELKRLNKQRNTVKLADGGYDQKEISMDYMLSLGGASEFNESYFADTVAVSRSHNFEENIVNEISIATVFDQFDDVTKEALRMHYYEKKSIKEISKELKYNYHTFRIMFYHHIRPKFLGLLEANAS